MTEADRNLGLNFEQGQRTDSHSRYLVRWRRKNQVSVWSVLIADYSVISRHRRSSGPHHHRDRHIRVFCKLSRETFTR